MLWNGEYLDEVRLQLAPRVPIKVNLHVMEEETTAIYIIIINLDCAL